MMKTTQGSRESTLATYSRATYRKSTDLPPAAVTFEANQMQASYSSSLKTLLHFVTLPESHHKIDCRFNPHDQF
jgi:hypothetical protein